MAFYSDSAKAKIIAADPTAANWINSRPYRPSAARTVRTAASARPNKFPGPCQRCHGHVAAGEGILGDKSGGRFVIFHADGTCPDKQSAPAAAAEQPKTANARRNRYAGRCDSCGGWVEAEQGLLVGSKGAWKTLHDGECPKAAAEPEQTAQAAPERSGKPNLYGGRCADCGEWVEAEAGVRVRTDGKWGAAHRTGQCPEEIEEAEGGRIELTEAQIDQLPTGYATVILSGGDFYAVKDGSDAVDYRTFRLRLRKETARRHPGALEIAYLAGRNNESDYMPLGIVKDGALVCRKAIHSDGMRDALAVLLADPAAAQLGWTIASECCNRCGRTLTVPASLHNGRGPECVNKR